jgi:hypothetical protein
MALPHENGGEKREENGFAISYLLLIKSRRGREGYREILVLC